MPAAVRYWVRSSAILLVRVVTRTRSFRAERALISPMRSSICPVTGRTSGHAGGESGGHPGRGQGGLSAQ